MRIVRTGSRILCAETHELVPLTFHWTTIFLCLVYDAVALGTDMFQLLLQFEMWIRITILVGGNLVSLCTALAAVYVLGFFFPRGIPSFLISVIVSFAVMLYIDVLPVAHPVFSSWGWLISFYILEVITFEFFLQVFALLLPFMKADIQRAHGWPKYVQEERPKAPEPAFPPGAAPEQAEEKEPARISAIRIGREWITVSSIRTVSAKGNYVEVRVPDRTICELCPLQEVLNQIPVEIGFQVHRSHWVAYDAVAGIRREGRDVVVDTGRFGTIPVSRNRYADFKKELNAQHLYGLLADAPHHRTGSTGIPGI